MGEGGCLGMPFWNAWGRGLGADSWTRTFLFPPSPNLSPLDLSALASGIFPKSPPRSLPRLNLFQICSDGDLPLLVAVSPYPGRWGGLRPSSPTRDFPAWAPKPGLGAESGSLAQGGARPGPPRRVAGGQPRPYLCKPIRPRLADKSGWAAEVSEFGSLAPAYRSSPVQPACPST